MYTTLRPAVVRCFAVLHLGIAALGYMKIRTVKLSEAFKTSQARKANTAKKSKPKHSKWGTAQLSKAKPS